MFLFLEGQHFKSLGKFRVFKGTALSDPEASNHEMAYGFRSLEYRVEQRDRKPG